jgi:hypothetical protein
MHEWIAGEQREVLFTEPLAIRRVLAVPFAAEGEALALLVIVGITDVGRP